MPKLHKVALDFLTAFSFNYNNQKIKAYSFITDNGFLFFPMHDDEILLNIPLENEIKTILMESVSYTYNKTYKNNIQLYNQIVYATRESLKKLFKSNKMLKQKNYKIIPPDKIDMDNILDIIFEAINNKKNNSSINELIQNRIQMFKKSLLTPIDELKQTFSEDIINYCALLSSYLFFQVHSDSYNDKECFNDKMKELRKDIIKQEKTFLKQNYYYNIAYTLRSTDTYISQSFNTFTALCTFYKKIYDKLDKYYLVFLNGQAHMEITRTTMNALVKNYATQYPLIWD